MPQACTKQETAHIRTSILQSPFNVTTSASLEPVRAVSETPNELPTVLHSQSLDHIQLRSDRLIHGDGPSDGWVNLVERPKNPLADFRVARDLFGWTVLVLESRVSRRVGTNPRPSLPSREPWRGT